MNAAIEAAASDMDLRDKVAPERLRQAVSVDIEIALNKVGILLTAEQGNVAADAAIATVQEAGWQDIATAPKGEWILIHRHAPKTQWHRRTEVAQYTPRSDWGSFNRHFPPTHWMPLPPPPFEGTKHD